MGIVRFENDHFAVITGYGDYVQGNLTICHVYYVEGLGHNLFLVGQFCDGDLEVAFRSNTCYVWNLEGDDLLTGSRYSNLYTISIFKMAASSPVYLMSRATSTKSWLWHRRLSYLNFGTINQLTLKDLVDGLSKFKYNKDHLCSACKQGKSKKDSLPPKLVPSTESKLELLHIDLYGLMRVASINGKKYILVIVDNYSRYTWVYFLHTNDEALDMIIDFINQVQRNLKAQILMIRTDNGTEFKNNLCKVRIALLYTHDLDNLFGPLYEEYYATSSPEVSDNSAANTLDNDNTSSSSSIIVEEDEAPQIDPSNMHEFHQKHRSSDRWTKNHPIEQVISDPSKPIMTRNGLQTDVEVCMYALIVSTIEPKNIKEAMLDHSWIESMQDELNQFKRLDVWELVKCPIGRNIISVKWIWKNKTDAEKTVIRNKSRLVAKDMVKRRESILRNHLH
ncbi:integrase, catalytic region, zinc finger, CCHC-type containing protein [Tanacetum coccineum]